MSDLRSWGFLAGGAVVILVPSVAVLTGWRPCFLRGSRGPVSLLGITGLCVYAGVLVDEIPCVVGVSSGVHATCAYIGLGLMGTAVGLFILYDVLVGADRRGRK
ncbi:hypothetical protein ACVW0K_006047 [Streptomyces filamentosus]